MAGVEKDLEEHQEEPERKKKRLSLSLQSNDRFNFIVEDSELFEAMKGNTVKNTAANNKWALNNFSQWYTERQKKLPLSDQLDPEPLNMLLSDNHEELCKVLSSFVMETRKEDGKEYTPK